MTPLNVLSITDVVKQRLKADLLYGNTIKWVWQSMRLSSNNCIFHDLITI